LQKGQQLYVDVLGKLHKEKDLIKVENAQHLVLHVDDDPGITSKKNFFFHNFRSYRHRLLIVEIDYKNKRNSELRKNSLKNP
jgi:hypothetical protein